MGKSENDIQVIRGPKKIETFEDMNSEQHV